jgi:hypothetical protein
MGLFLSQYTNIGRVVQGDYLGYYIYDGTCVGADSNTFALIRASYIRVNFHGVIWYENQMTGVDSKDYLDFISPQNVASYQEISSYQSGPSGNAMLKGTMIGGIALGLSAAMNSMQYSNDIAIYFKNGKSCIIHLTDGESAQKMKSSLYKIMPPVRQIKQPQAKNPKGLLQNPYEEIKKLKELLDIGAITQKEYDKKKKQLLNLEV